MQKTDEYNYSKYICDFQATNAHNYTIDTKALRSQQLRVRFSGGEIPLISW